MLKVMVVDDAYSELTVVETILHSAGFDVVTYLGGDQLEEKRQVAAGCRAKSAPEVHSSEALVPLLDRAHGEEMKRSTKRL
jgi:CheY-like chemotaxis protein